MAPPRCAAGCEARPSCLRRRLRTPRRWGGEGREKPSPPPPAVCSVRLAAAKSLLESCCARSPLRAPRCWSPAGPGSDRPRPPGASTPRRTPLRLLLGHSGSTARLSPESLRGVALPASPATCARRRPSLRSGTSGLSLPSCLRSTRRRGYPGLAAVTLLSGPAATPGCGRVGWVRVRGGHVVGGGEYDFGAV